MSTTLGLALPARRARRRLAGGRTALAALCFVGPFLGFLLVFQYWPLLRMVVDSLYSYQLLNPDQRSFIGLDNYRMALTDPQILQSFAVTLLFATGLGLTIIPCAFFLAVYLHGRLPARSVVRTIVFLPVVTSSVVVATVWTFLLDPNAGLLNGALAQFGLGRLGLLTSTTQALPTLVGVMLWQ